MLVLHYVLLKLGQDKTCRAPKFQQLQRAPKNKSRLFESFELKMAPLKRNWEENLLHLSWVVYS